LPDEIATAKLSKCTAAMLTLLLCRHIYYGQQSASRKFLLIPY